MAQGCSWSHCACGTNHPARDSSSAMARCLLPARRPPTGASLLCAVLLVSLASLPIRCTSFAPSVLPARDIRAVGVSGTAAVARAAASPSVNESSEKLSSAPIATDDDGAAQSGSVQDRADLLDDALRFNSTASASLVEHLSALRRSGAQSEAESYLDDLLSIVDDGSERRPLWARSARFSRRARLASLGRVVDMSTPAAEEGEEDDADAEESARRRRRRSLAVLLRTLAKENEEEEASSSKSTGKMGRLGFRRPIIRTIERAALKDAKEGAATDDMANRLPAGLETPKYDVIVRRPPSQGGYEIRRYDAFSVCTVPMNRPRPAADRERTDAKISEPQLSGASSFGALAGYLFGKNSDSTAMKMTTPVLTSNAGQDDREMSFVLPSDYWDEDGTERAPRPLDGSGVRLERDDGGERAAVMFGGFASKSEVEEKKARLLRGLEDDAEYCVKEGESVTLAQYNDPFTPPWKRRNEVSVPVVPRK